LRPSQTGFPWSTFGINVSGSLLVGLLVTVLTERLDVDPRIRVVVILGFLGGYTTFSTLSYETFALIDRGRVGLALVYSLGSLLAGVLAVWAGIALARAF
jgi:CrcB protein